MILLRHRSTNARINRNQTHICWQSTVQTLQLCQFKFIIVGRNLLAVWLLNVDILDSGQTELGQRAYLRALSLFSALVSVLSPQ